MARLSSRRAGGAAVWVVVIVVVLAVGAAAGWYFFLRSTPEKTMHQFVAALKSGNAEALKPLVASKDRNIVGRIAALGSGLKEGDFRVGVAKIEGGKATVAVTAELLEGEAKKAGTNAETMTYVLIKENGKWVVDFEETAKALFQSMGLGGTPMGGK